MLNDETKDTASKVKVKVKAKDSPCDLKDVCKQGSGKLNA